MWTIALKTLRANLSRFVATLIAIAVGVGFLTAGTMVTNSIANSLGGEIDTQYAAVSVAVVPTEKEANDRGGQASVGLETSALEPIAAIDGVRSAVGEIQGSTRLVDDPTLDEADDIASNRGVSVRVWTEVEDLNPLQLDDGRAPSEPNEITVDRGFAEDKGLSLGDRVEFGTATGAQEVEIVGITRFGSTNAPDVGGTVTAAEPWVFELAGSDEPAYSQILVAGDGSLSDRELARRVQATLPDGFSAETGAVFREDAKGESAAILDLLRPVLQGFSGLALFVCCFVIFNTFKVVVGQRTRELALMRAVAATPRQIRRSLRVEGLGIGLLGSILGLVLGTLLTYLLSRVLEAFDLDLPAAQISLTPGIVITGIVVGTLITFVSVQIPAWRAGRTAPIEAMRESALEPGRVGKVRLVIATVMVVGGLGAMVTKNAWLLGLGSFLSIIGIFLLGPALVSGFARLTRPIFGRLGMAGRLSSDNVARNPNRTATTMNALVIGLLLVTLVTVAGTSLKKTTVDTVNKYSSADYLVGAATGEIEPEVLDRIEDIDGVETVARLRTYPVNVDGHPDSLTAVDPAKLSDIGIKTESGSLAELGDGVAVANIDGTAVIGATKEYTDQLGNKIDLEVTAVLEFSIDAFSIGSVVSPETLAKYSPDAGETGALIRVDNDQVSEVGKQLRKITVGYGNVQVVQGNIFGRIIESIFDFLINAVNGLLGMSVVIALIGIVNTLTLSIFERRRELGLLRAVGMTSQSVRRMIRLEALQMSLLGTIVGMVSGTVLAWLLLRATDLSELDLDGVRLGILLVLGILLGVVAAIAPTRRVTKLNVLEAIEVT